MIRFSLHFAKPITNRKLTSKVKVCILIVEPKVRFRSIGFTKIFLEMSIWVIPLVK